MTRTCLHSMCCESKWVTLGPPVRQSASPPVRQSASPPTVKYSQLICTTLTALYMNSGNLTLSFAESNSSLSKPSDPTPTVFARAQTAAQDHTVLLLTRAGRRETHRLQVLAGYAIMRCVQTSVQRYPVGRET